MSHYDTLGVDPGASADEIRSAYRRAAAAAHPDRDGGCAERMAQVNEAWEVLGDPARRAAYDEDGAGDPARQRLRMLFDSYLQSPSELPPFASILSTFRQRVLMAQATLQSTGANLDRQMTRLRRDAGRVRRRDGVEAGLWLAAVERRLAALQRDRTGVDEETTINDRLLQLLDEYEDASGQSSDTTVTRSMLTPPC